MKYIAGELYFHLLIFPVLYGLYKIFSSFEEVAYHTMVVDLNAHEDRIPESLIDVLGTFVLM